MSAVLADDPTGDGGGPPGRVPFPVMYETHPCFDTPPDDEPIWRYTKWPKFCSVLTNSALFFVRADQFEDPWEGVYPPAHFTREHLLAPVKHIIEEEPHREDEYHDRARANVLTMQDERRKLGVSCWHLADGESDTHWRSYSQMDQGVAIRSTIGRLKGALSVCPVDIHIGKVKYYSGKNALIEEGNVFWPALRKREAFKNDREVRAIVWNSSTVSGFGEKGAYAKVDVDHLVQELVVSPSAAFWFTEMVKDVVGRFGLSFPVTRSTLFDPPDYSNP